MDRKILDSKFESVRRCIDSLESKRPFPFEKLESDFDLQDIISMNLVRAIKSSIDIAAILNSEMKGPAPSTMSACFDSIYQEKVISQGVCQRLKKAIGLRNLLVNEYAKIDWKIILNVLTQHLDDYRKFVQEVDDWLRKNP